MRILTVFDTCSGGRQNVPPGSGIEKAQRNPFPGLPDWSVLGDVLTGDGNFWNTGRLQSRHNAEAADIYGDYNGCARKDGCGFKRNRILDGNPQVALLKPLDVLDMHNLIARSFMVMTDSGGLQEEAPSFGKPVLVMRTETERPEAVEAGVVKVAGVKKEDIVNLADELLSDPEKYVKMAKAINPYRDGHASERIVRIYSGSNMDGCIFDCVDFAAAFKFLTIFLE